MCGPVPLGGGFVAAGGGGQAGGTTVVGGGAGNAGGAAGPRLTAPGPAHIVVADPFTFTVSATPEPAAWLWSVTGPDGQGQPIVGATTGRPTFTARLAGQHLVSVTATNDAGVGTTLNFPLVVSAGRVLPFQPTAVAAHRASNRIALGREPTPAVELIDALTGLMVRVPVTRVPLSLAFTPDGSRVVVGEVAQVEVIALTGASPSVIARWPLASDVTAITASETHAYWSNPTDRSVNWVRLDTGTTGTRSDASFLSKLQLHPDGTRLYATSALLQRLVRLDLASDGGAVLAATESRYGAQYPLCDQLWLSHDGRQLVSGCGVLFRLAPLAADDLVYGGRLPQLPYRSVDDSVDGGDFVALTQLVESFPDRTQGPLLVTLGHASLTQTAVRSLPSRTFSGEGLLIASFVFVDSTNRTHALLVGREGVPTPRTVWLTFEPGVP
ncbi:MAG: PKD domain-containing protein [Myxococcaceae bacterium]|nr:PKD domain-containing protein [Myxococcaceae bacterium]